MNSGKKNNKKMTWVGLRNRLWWSNSSKSYNLWI